jgi:hypothetical protein
MAHVYSQDFVKRRVCKWRVCPVGKEACWIFINVEALIGEDFRNSLPTKIELRDPTTWLLPRSLRRSTGHSGTSSNRIWNPVGSKFSEFSPSGVSTLKIYKIQRGPFLAGIVWNVFFNQKQWDGSFICLFRVSAWSLTMISLFQKCEMMTSQYATNNIALS